MTFVLLSLLDSIRSDIASGSDSLVKPKVSARERGPQCSGQREPWPRFSSSSSCRCLAQYPGKAAFSSSKWSCSFGGLWHAPRAHSCLASPDAIMGQAFAASAEQAGVTGNDLHTPRHSLAGEHWPGELCGLPTSCALRSSIFLDVSNS